MLCNICPRQCNIDRNVSRGYCGASENLRAGRAELHMWEEPIISGDKGSGAIFFSGCNLKCAYCQNFEISRGAGQNLTIGRLADIFKELEDKGAHNINLVTGSHYAVQIVKALDIYKPKVPVIFNCGGYESDTTLKILDGYIDIYLPDFKYSDSALAKKYSNAVDYFEVASNAISVMRAQVGEDVVQNGLMKKGMIIRHLVLPNSLNNTFGVIDYLSTNISKSSYISLMGQYVPCGNSKDFEDISRPLKALEYKIAVNYLDKAGFYNAYIQEIASADKVYIPQFDGRGI